MENQQNPAPRSASLSELEQEAARKLDAELREYVVASERVYNLIGIALDRAPTGPIRKVSPSCFATRLLLIRLRNDLRCAALLAARGYGEQSCSVVASLYESAFTILSIGGDGDLPRRWVNIHPALTAAQQDRAIALLRQRGMVRLAEFRATGVTATTVARLDLNWAVVTRDKCSPTPRCSVNFTTPAILRRSRTILELLGGAGLLTGLSKFAHRPARQRGRARSSKS